MIKAIFFDLDDTLHDFKRVSGGAMVHVYEEIVKRYGLDKTRLRERYSELITQAEEHAFLDGRLSTDYRTERFRNLLQTFGIQDEGFVKELVGLYRKELENGLSLFPGFHSRLKDLQQKYDLCIVTEGPVDAQQRTIEILGIKDYFKRIFISGELKKIKSTGELFKHAIKESGYSAQEIMLIGDSYKRDVLGGLRAGLKVVWLNRKNEKIADGDPKPHSQIKSLDELEANLKKNEKFTPILILGHPRSGTNFVSAIFSSHPSVNLLVEPLSQHSRFFSDYDSVYWKKTDFDPVNLHVALMAMPAAIEFAREFKKWLYFDTGEARVFKETTFFFQLEWLKEYLPDLKIIYIERNPHGVVSSFKKSDFFNRWNYSERFRVLAEQVNNCKDLEGYRPMVAKVSGSSWVDQLTTMWYIRTREARKGLQLFDHNIFKYEDLIVNPQLQFAEMFKFAGLELTNQVMETIRDRCQETRGGEFSTFRDSKKVAGEWKRVLDADEKRIIRRKYLRITGDARYGKRRRTVT